MELNMIAGRTGCLVGRQLIGLYLTDDAHCVLLDCGTVSMREELEAALAEANLTPVGILCTHTHFDHLGNAAYFQRTYHIPVALPFGEAELCRTAAAVKSHLFVYSAGQIDSDPELQDLPCTVDRVIMPEQEQFVFCTERFGILHTPGHSPDHISVVTPDGVCYAGDALMCGHNLLAAKLPYAYNFRQSLASFPKFKTCGCHTLLLAHKGVITAPFDDIIEKNRAAMEHRLLLVRNIVNHQMTTEEIYTAVRQAMGITVKNPRQALSLERFLRPYLECLIDDGTHRQSIRDGLLCYEPV
ncbi:MAG: MBL fold metallo-hydrolase [Oscillospiraceae bacterium]|nr:MBL fold metallo-hydrolase [Oscillospiraceae bacterium]